MGLDAASVVGWEHKPHLRQPVMIAAFEGWSDAGDAASLAASYLTDAWPVRRFASIDPEEFYDFTSTRPQVHFDANNQRGIIWPKNVLLAGPVPGTSRDAVILAGVEPQLRWRAFSSTVVGIARTLGVQLVMTLGALLADVPHTRPVPVAGAAYEPAVASRFGLPISRYEGETGIVGVLHDACARAGIASIGLWASVPHYVHQVSSPRAAVALVERAALMLGTSVDPVELRAAGEVYVQQVSERVADDDEASAYVAQLEEAADRLAAEGPPAGLPIATGDSLAAEAERFLRDQRRDGPR